VNDHELEQYEAELRRTPPARLPEHFMARLRAAKPGPALARTMPVQLPAAWPVWRGVLRWLAPALAVAAAGLLVWRTNLNPGSGADKMPPAAARGLKADDVQVDQELVSSFDVVAKLPGGEPVRFSCRQWRDQWSVTDTNRGVEIVQDSPRVEVVPVRFETY
jgi:hypothetical protein